MDENEKKIIIGLFYIAIIYAAFFSAYAGWESVLQPLSAETGELTPKFLINVLGNW